MVLEGADKLMVENFHLKLALHKKMEAQVLVALQAEREKLAVERAALDAEITAAFGVGLLAVRRDEAGQWVIDLPEMESE